MRKNEQVLNARRAYIAERIIEAQKEKIKTDAIVQELCDELFLSRDIIYKDFRSYKEEIKPIPNNRY